MRRRLAAIAAVCFCCAAPAVHAGTYTIDFDSLAAYSGQAITTTIQEGPFGVHLNDVTVIGPGDPSYAGSIGVTIPDDGYDIAITDSTGPGPGSPFDWYSISGSFATTAAGANIAWYGATQPAAASGPFFQFFGTAPETLTQSPNPSPYTIPLFLLEVSNQNAAQLLGLTIVADLGPAGGGGAVPEPSAALMGIVALSGTMLAGRRITGTKGRCRPSRRR